MNFKEALEAMENGKYVRRDCWGVDGYFLFKKGINVLSIGMRGEITPRLKWEPDGFFAEDWRAFDTPQNIKSTLVLKIDQDTFRNIQVRWVSYITSQRKPEFDVGQRLILQEDSSYRLQMSARVTRIEEFNRGYIISLEII